MKLQLSRNIHHVQNQTNLCSVNLYRAYINPSLGTWIPFKGFHSRIIQPYLQNIYGSNVIDHTAYQVSDCRSIQYSTLSLAKISGQYVLGTSQHSMYQHFPCHIDYHLYGEHCCSIFMREAIPTKSYLFIIL